MIGRELRASSRAWPPGARVGAGLLLLVVLAAAVGPLVATHEPNTHDYLNKLAAPSAENWLGTDQYGRDVFARTMAGLRLSFLSAVLVLVGSVTVSLAVGVLAAFGGVVDVVASRVIDVLLAIPSLVLALAVVGLLGPGYLNLLIALVISSWAADARIARALTLRARSLPHVVAARLAGVSGPATAVRHVLPAVVPQVAIVATVRLGTVVVALAGLSFLGLGVQPPTAELGAMLDDARGFITRAPWLLVWPSAAILVTALGANLVAEGLHARSLAEQG